MVQIRTSSDEIGEVELDGEARDELELNEGVVEQLHLVNPRRQ